MFLGSLCKDIDGMMQSNLGPALSAVPSLERSSSHLDRGRSFRHQDSEDTLPTSQVIGAGHVLTEASNQLSNSSVDQNRSPQSASQPPQLSSFSSESRQSSFPNPAQRSSTIMPASPASLRTLTSPETPGSARSSQAHENTQTQSPTSPTSIASSPSPVRSLSSRFSRLISPR